MIRLIFIIIICDFLVNKLSKLTPAGILIILVICQCFLHTFILHFIILANTRWRVRFKFMILNFICFVVFFLLLYFFVIWFINLIWLILELSAFIYISYKHWDIVKRGFI